MTTPLDVIKLLLTRYVLLPLTLEKVEFYLRGVTRSCTDVEIKRLPTIRSKNQIPRVLRGPRFYLRLAWYWLIMYYKESLLMDLRRLHGVHLIYLRLQGSLLDTHDYRGLL